MKLTALQLVVIGIAMGAGGYALGWLLENGIARLSGPRRLLATGALFAGLAAVACVWLWEDLQRAGVL